MSGDVVVVGRHEIDVDEIDQRIEEYFEDVEFTSALLESKPWLTERIFTYSKTIAAYCSVGDPRAALLPFWDATVMAMQASSAMFLNANNEGREIEFMIGYTNTYRTTGRGPNYNTAAGEWLAAVYFAVVCRRRDRVLTLCETSIETLRASGAVYDEYIYDWVTAVQTFFRREDGVVRALITAMNAADPEVVQRASPELLLLVLYPPIELLYFATQGDAEEFNARLLRAVQDHHRYWSKTEERRRDVQGFIAWGPLAIACIALDMGMEITVESDYLPRHLLLGTRVDEGPRV